MRSWIAFSTIVVLPLGGAGHPLRAEEGHDETSDSQTSGFRLSRYANWIFRSLLRDESDDATTLGLEFESQLSLNKLEVKNITYFEVAEYARGVPGQPAGNPGSSSAAPADGITDLLTAFWFSKKGQHHSKHHFAPGFAAQFPTASDDTLGSGKWSLGPSFEYESGRWFAGAISLQV